jgi:predicted esterase
MRITEPAPVGLQRLGLGAPRDGVFAAPPGYDPNHPAPLVLMLHGAGGDGRSGITPFLPLIGSMGAILVAPDSRGSTWDILRGGYGPDVAFINRAFEMIFSRYAVDSNHLAIEGFSDGASYALSLGITNGAFFTNIIAFSPGFSEPAAHQDEPVIFISHGTHDNVLPIEHTSRRIARHLKRLGYLVRYEEFDGGHTVPPQIAQDAANWFLHTS